MNFDQFTKLVSEVKIGKHLPTAIYLHKSALDSIPKPLKNAVTRVSAALKIQEKQWNILKLSKRDFNFSLLSYPTFEVEPYPALVHSWTIDCSKLGMREADYSNSDNPPILHRRESFLPPAHPQQQAFSEFTVEGEAIGLYENTRIIGTQRGWHRLIKRKGYYIDTDGHLRPLSEKHHTENSGKFDGKIERHRTALSRDKLSLPMFLMAQRGYLDGSYSILDYRCGKGDDLRELESRRIDCMGWDPVHRPDTDLEPCDIVNLGYVINVIEDREERQATLSLAYAYATKLLVVSVMLGNERIYENFKPYADGVITARNTFQKYFTQGELKQYLEQTLDDNVIAIAPGIFAVFRDKKEEQIYLAERYRTRHQWREKSVRSTKKLTKKLSKSAYEKHKELLEDFWYTCLELGRLPAYEEFELSGSLTNAFGSYNKAFNLC